MKCHWLTINLQLSISECNTFKGQPEKNLNLASCYHSGEPFQSPVYLSSKSHHCVSLGFLTRSIARRSKLLCIHKEWLYHVTLSHAILGNAQRLPPSPAVHCVPAFWYHVVFFHLLELRMSHISQLLIKMFPMNSTKWLFFTLTFTKTNLMWSVMTQDIALWTLTGRGSLLTFLLVHDS